MKKVVIPVFSVLMSIVFLIGTAGITVIVRDCACCGPSVRTDLFEQFTRVESSCCDDMDVDSPKSGAQSLESECCTFVTESLKLNNYISAEKITLNLSSDIQPPSYILSVYKLPAVYLKNISYQNKHGGRDMVISNCQYLI